MRTPSRRSSRFAVVLLSASVSASFALAAGCKKEKPGAAKETTPASKAAEPGSKGEMKAPEVAIGANRVETFMAAAKQVADHAEYSVSIAVPTAAGVGKESAAHVILNPKKGWKLNEEFPYSLVVTPPEGVSVAKAKQAKADAVTWEQKKAGAWAVGFTPDSAGNKAFTAKFVFAVCTDATCNPHTEELAFNVDVK